MQVLQFLPEGHFYEMINTYKVALGGLLMYHKDCQPALKALNDANNGRLVGIASNTVGDITIDPFESIYHMDIGLISLGKVTDNLAFMLVNIAYESVKAKLDKSNPVHEFFRHVRNAASHGGKWAFMGHEPSRHAEWRSKVITNALNGQELLGPIIAPGDILILLWDVEQSII